MDQYYFLLEEKMKLFFGIMAAAVILFSGCSKKSAPADTSTGNNLVVWSFTDEIDDMVNNYYKRTHPDVTIEYSLTPADQFPNKLDPVLSSGQGTPDIFALEVDFVRKYVESGLLLDITDIYEANKSRLLPYPVEIGSYNGRVYAMSWQACPGAMFYRRSLAKKYLGTDDPKVVQTYFTDMNKFLETARLLKNSSNGACVVVSSLTDLAYPAYSSRKDPWIVNGKLVIDPAIDAYLDLCKIMHDNRWEGRVGQWSEGWFAGMKDMLKDESGRVVEVFAYFLPTWGVHYVLKNDAPETAGDWAMVPGPVAYNWGGTWIAAWKGTRNPAAAKELIRYLTTDDDFLEAYAKASGDMVSNIAVVDKIKDSYSEPYLGGQNHYTEFAAMARNVDGKLTQSTDLDIQELLDEIVAQFVNGEKTKAQALADFRTQVEAHLGL
jgi:ABC-type glycerol-3-phosphate transport system substrate-binding protein